MEKEIKLSSSTYDKDADVLYVNFEGDEPTVYEDLENDFIWLLVEVGILTGKVYGFRIIGLKHLIKMENNRNDHKKK